jgi:hypothetical protein
MCCLHRFDGALVFLVAPMKYWGVLKRILEQLPSTSAPPGSTASPTSGRVASPGKQAANKGTAPSDDVDSDDEGYEEGEYDEGSNAKASGERKFPPAPLAHVRFTYDRTPLLVSASSMPACCCPHLGRK